MSKVASRPQLLESFLGQLPVGGRKQHGQLKNEKIVLNIWLDIGFEGDNLLIKCPLFHQALVLEINRAKGKVV
jgi:hypothetical protein